MELAASLINFITSSLGVVSDDVTRVTAGGDNGREVCSCRVILILMFGSSFSTRS